MEKKRVDKLFMENPKIYAGWLDLNVNNDIVIPVSYLNSRFFYDLLNISLIIDSWNDITYNHLDLCIDCEGTEAHIRFSIAKDHNVKVIVSKEWYNFKNNTDGVDIFQYLIPKNNLINNIFDIIENNVELYNSDFCCDDIADYITKEYVSTLRKNLILF